MLFFVPNGAVHCLVFFFSSRRRHTRCLSDWSSDVCSSDLRPAPRVAPSPPPAGRTTATRDRKSTRLNSSHLGISYAVFCLKKKKKNNDQNTKKKKINKKNNKKLKTQTK